MAIAAVVVRCWLGNGRACLWDAMERNVNGWLNTTAVRRLQGSWEKKFQVQRFCSLMGYQMK